MEAYQNLLDLNLLILRGQLHERFEHSFSSIGPTGAEIRPVELLSKHLFPRSAKNKELVAAKRFAAGS
jgi:hypothetical protein